MKEPRRPQARPSAGSQASGCRSDPRGAGTLTRQAKCSPARDGAHTVLLLNVLCPGFTGFQGPSRDQSANQGTPSHCPLRWDHRYLTLPGTKSCCYGNHVRCQLDNKRHSDQKGHGPAPSRHKPAPRKRQGKGHGRVLSSACSAGPLVVVKTVTKASLSPQFSAREG